MARLSSLEEYLDREFGELGIQDASARAQRTLDAAPQISAAEGLGTDPAAQPAEWGGIAGERQVQGGMDRTRLLGAGVLDAAEMGVGALEYVARQNKFLRPSVAPVLENVRGSIGETREGILSGISPEYLERVGKEVMTLDPTTSVWRSGNPIEIADAIYGKFVRSLPSTVAVMLPAGRLFKAGNTAGALTYLGASEGGLSLGAIQNNIADEIAAMTNEELLAESEAYARIYDAVGGDEVRARQDFTAEAQGAAPIIGGAAVASISLVTGRLLKPVFSEGGLPVGRRIGQGFLAEAPQEGSQGAAEQLTQNFAAQIYDSERALSEGVLEAAGQEGLIGGLTGGAVSGAFGQRPARPPSPPVEDEGGQLTLPGFGPQISDPAARDVAEEDTGIPIPETDVTEDGRVVLRQDEAEVGRRNEQLDLGPGMDFEQRTEYTTHGGERVPLPEDMQRRGRDLSDETGFTMPDTATAPTGFAVWVEDTKGKTQGKESKQKEFETQEEADKYAARLKKGLNKDKGQQVRTAAGQRVVPTMPDIQDRPSAEPVGDLEAQLNDLGAEGGRVAVYLSPEQRDAPRTLPKGVKTIPNWDGRGGTLIVRAGKKAAKQVEEARKAWQNGEISLQQAIGQLTQAGQGKPVQGRYVVQLLDDRQNVARESMVSTRSEALRLKHSWGPNARITTPEEAIQRRDTLIEEEQAQREADKILEEREAATREREKVEYKRRVEDRAAEQEFDETISDEDVERLATYNVVYPEAYDEVDPESKATTYAERRQTQSFETREEAEQFAEKQDRRAQAHAISYGTKATKSRIEVEGSEELDVQFERAVRARGDRKAQSYDESPTGKDKLGFQRQERTTAPVEDEEAQPTEAAESLTTDISQVKERDAEPSATEVAYGEQASVATTVEKRARQEYGKTPGKKLKFIRRERGAQVRRKAEIRDVKDTPVERPAGPPVRTRSLTYESIPAEESRQQKQDRLAKVKAAETRLRLALSRAKRFAQRFETTGVYGAFTGKGYLEARKHFEELVQLGQALLTPKIIKVSVVHNGEIVNKQFDTRKDAERWLRRTVGLAEDQVASKITEVSTKKTSSGHATALNRTAIALERVKLKGMSPEQFTKEFSAAKERQLQKAERTKAQKKRETRGEKQRKIAKDNAERRSAEKWRAIRQAWRNDPLYNEVIAPVLDKLYEVAQRNFVSGREEVYTPTEFEMKQIRYALRTWQMAQRYNQDIFYTPLRDELARNGFVMDDTGNVDIGAFETVTSEQPPSGLVQLRSGEIFEDPSVPVLESKKTVKPIKVPDEMKADVAAEKAALKERKPVRQQMRPTTPAMEGSRRAEFDEAMDIAEERNAVRDIRAANALITRFKEKVSKSKITINGIIRQEQRLIRGLRKIGAWRDTGTNRGVIHLGGWKSKTYIMVGPRIGKTLDKAAAKRSVGRIAKIPVPKELLPVARMLDKVPSEQARIDTLVEKNSLDLFMENVLTEETDPQLTNAASVVGDLIRDPYTRVNVNNVLDAIVENLPSDHFYHQLAAKLRGLDMGNITLQYDWAGVKFRGRKKGNPGVYDPNTGRAYLNRDVMLDEMGAMTHAKAIHTILHETLHAATQHELKVNNNLRNHFFQVRAAAVAAWKQQFGNKNMPYGLRIKQLEGGRITPLDEFVAEVYADPELQEFLKGVPVTLDGGDGTMLTAWRHITRALVELLGWGNVPRVTNLFDAFMAPADTVFRGAGRTASGADLLNMEAFDSVLGGVQERFLTRFNNSQGIMQRVREAAKSAGRFSNAAMNLMSMEQFTEVFDQYFGGTIQKYVSAFNRRNAKAARYMEIPQRLSGRWTQLEESNSAEATEMSEIMSQATLHSVVASAAPDSKANEHLTSIEAQQMARELHERFNNLSESTQKLYRDVRSYYKSQGVLEQQFLLQSGLRGITGVDFTQEQLAEVKTREDLTSLLEEHINEEDLKDVIDTLYEMSRVPLKHKGDYFPAMRYGEHVVYAQKEGETEVFEDRKEAWARRAELQSLDATLDVQMRRNKQSGDWEVTPIEREFVMAENRSDIEKAHARLVSQYGAEAVFDPQRMLSKETDRQITSNKQLQGVLGALEGNPAAQAAIKQFYLRSLSETSMRKHELRRKNRRGLDLHTQHRNLATYARQSSYYTAQLEFGWQMAEAMDELQQFVKKRRAGPNEVSTDNLSKVVNHLIKRDQMGLNLPDVNKFVRAGVEGTHFFMLTSPSYWAINATQPWMISLPTMAARHGYAETTAALGSIQRLIAPSLTGQVKKTKGGISAFRDRVLREQTFNIIDQVIADIKMKAGTDTANDYIELIEELRDNHVIDINVFTEMREMAAGRAEGNITKLVDASRIMAHLTEVNNRVLTALSAYQLELNKTGDKAAAKAYAAKMVSQTQFNYSSQNKPPLFQPGGPLGPVAPLMFQFMQWPQHMYAHLIRNFAKIAADDPAVAKEARRAVYGLLGTHAMVGGMTGMMLQPIKWAFGFAMMMFGDDDEPYTLANTLSGKTFDHFVADAADQAFGTTMSTFISKGAPAAFLGVDLSARMSMGTFYYVDLRGDTPQGVLGSLLASFGGATLNQGLKFGKGVQEAMRGDVLRGVETASPKMLRDVLRAVRYYNEGLVNAAGDTVIDADEMSIYEVLMQGIGFSPSDVSQAYEAQGAIKDAERYATDRRSDLLRRYRLADSASERSAIRDEIRNFNRSNRQEAITASALLQNIRSAQRRESRFRRYGANIDERKARFYERYGDPYRDE